MTWVGTKKANPDPLYDDQHGRVICRNNNSYSCYSQLHRAKIELKRYYAFLSVFKTLSEKQKYVHSTFDQMN